MKEREEEVKNLAEVKGRFLAMKEERSNSSLAATRTDNLLDWLLNRTAEDENRLTRCENSLEKHQAEVRELLLNKTQLIIEHEKNIVKYKACSESEDLTKCYVTGANCSEQLEKCTTDLEKAVKGRDDCFHQHSICSNELKNCETKHEKLVSNNAQMIRERNQYSFNYSACSDQLKRCAQSEHELRKNVSMLENENNKLITSYVHCSERLTTCEKSCKLIHLLYSRKCFQVMRDHIELICQPIFVI